MTSPSVPPLATWRALLTIPPLVPRGSYMPFSHVHTTANNQPEMQYCDCAHKNTTRRGAFGDALLEIDEIVGAVRRSLQAHGIDKNTLILFTGEWHALPFIPPLTTWQCPPLSFSLLVCATTRLRCL